MSVRVETVGVYLGFALAWTLAWQQWISTFHGPEKFIMFWIGFCFTIGYLGASFLIVRRTEAFVVERFGSFHRVCENGLNTAWALVDEVWGPYDLRLQRAVDHPISLITFDRHRLTLHASLEYQLVDVVAYHRACSGLKYERDQRKLTFTPILETIDSEIQRFASLYTRENLLNLSTRAQIGLRCQGLDQLQKLGVHVRSFVFHDV